MRLTTLPAVNGAGSPATLQDAVRSKAIAVLNSLLAAKADCDQQLAKLRRADAMKQVTGKSSLDEAIASTKRLIAELDEAAASARTKPSCEVEVRIGSLLTAAR